jgi:hypothetical protein
MGQECWSFVSAGKVLVGSDICWIIKWMRVGDGGDGKVDDGGGWWMRAR